MKSWKRRYVGSQKLKISEFYHFWISRFSRCFHGQERFFHRLFTDFHGTPFSCFSCFVLFRDIPWNFVIFMTFQFTYMNLLFSQKYVATTWNHWSITIHSCQSFVCPVIIEFCIVIPHCGEFSWIMGQTTIVVTSTVKINSWDLTYGTLAVSQVPIPSAQVYLNTPKV